MTKFEMMEDELRKKFPSSAAKAASGSRKEAIYMMCRVCTGSSQSAKDCTAKYCFLYPYRPGAKK